MSEAHNNNKKLSYRKQTARQLSTQYVESIRSNFMTLKSGLGDDSRPLQTSENGTIQ